MYIGGYLHLYPTKTKNETQCPTSVRFPARIRGKKMWLSMHPRNFTCEKIVRPYVRSLVRSPLHLSCCVLFYLFILSTRTFRMAIRTFRETEKKNNNNKSESFFRLNFNVGNRERARARKKKKTTETNFVAGAH